MHNRSSQFRFNHASPSAARARRSARPHAFSFPEVLFAVIVLGIGFIMVAAIFPVALQQSKLTQDESASASIAWANVGLVQGATTSNLPAPNAPNFNWPVVFMPTYAVPPTAAVPNPRTAVRPVENYLGTLLPAWNIVRGLEVKQDDPRYGYVLLYRRAGSASLTVNPAPAIGQPNKLPSDWAETAQIYLIQVMCRSAERPASPAMLKMNNVAVPVPARITPEFDQYDYAFDRTGTDNTPWTPTTPTTYTAVAPRFKNPNNLAAHQVMVQMEYNYKGLPTSVIAVNTTTSDTARPTQNLPGAIGEGSYVVISDDPTATSVGHTNVTGRIYRVGLRREDLDAGGDGQHAFYELQPGNDLQNNMENVAADVPAYCVGRERLANGTFIGATQDVSIYTTTISVKP